MLEQQVNRRTFERFSTRFPVKFKHSSSDFGSDVFLRDASASGIRITTKDRLFPNDSVSVLVKLPDDHNPLMLNGRVVWTKSRETNLWDIGLEFHQVQLMNLQRMFKYIDMM